MASGLLFLLPAYTAFHLQIHVLFFLSLAVVISTFTHLVFHSQIVRIIDYTLAASYVIACVWMVTVSGFTMPYSLYGFLTMSLAFAAYHQHEKTRQTCTGIEWWYILWHMLACITPIWCMFAYINSL